jgi:CBS domain containing-hemolysin-like protein
MFIIYNNGCVYLSKFFTAIISVRNLHLHRSIAVTDALFTRILFVLLYGIVASMGIVIIGFVLSALVFMTCGVSLIVATLLPYPVGEIADIALKHLNEYAHNPWYTISLLITMGSVGAWVLVRDAKEEERLQAQQRRNERCAALVEEEKYYSNLLTHNVPWSTHMTLDDE